MTLCGVMVDSTHNKLNRHAAYLMALITGCVSVADAGCPWRRVKLGGSAGPAVHDTSHAVRRRATPGGTIGPGQYVVRLSTNLTSMQNYCT